MLTSIRSSGERPIQTNLIQTGIYVRFKLPVMVVVTKTGPVRLRNNRFFSEGVVPKPIGKYRNFPQAPDKLSRSNGSL